MAINTIKTSGERRAFIIASDVYAQVQSRIIQTGKGSDGRKFKGYSTKPLPKYFFTGKSRNAGAEQRVAKAKKVSYKKFRQLNLLPVDHVSLYFTGAMWRGTGVTLASKAPGRVIVRIEGKTQEAEQKIEWNSLRYGPILEPSKKELNAARAAAKGLLIRELKTIFTK